MATDNMAFTPGSGGSARALADSGGVEWPVEILAYATALLPGANVTQVVTPQSPLPVVNPDATELLFRILRKLQYGVCSPDPFDDTDDSGGRTLDLLLTALNRPLVAKGLFTGGGTVGTTPFVQLPNVPALFGVSVKADPLNAGYVAVGMASNVTCQAGAASDGFTLGPGDSETFLVNNANLLFLLASAASQKYSFALT